MNVKRQVEIAFVRVAPAWSAVHQVQPRDCLARTCASIGVDYRNRIDEPVVAIAIAARGIARHLNLLRLWFGIHTFVATHIQSIERCAGDVRQPEKRTARERLTRLHRVHIVVVFTAFVFYVHGKVLSSPERWIGGR